MPRRRLRPEDYTVGWVCALPIELAAATGMLDEEHQDLPQDTNDTNLYTLGRIGEHNAVIACLPAGQTGNNSAGAVAVQMKLKFTSIRFGLMVGIGGGVPSDEADIRLGDVVISKPYMYHGGVVQYDFGKTTQSGFVRTGFLNTPPTTLLNALAKLQANHFIRRCNLLVSLSPLSHLPEFARDNAGPDNLFKSTYNHVGGPTCERCSKDRLLERTARGSQEIMVHYGTIASGNQVIKDGITRDRLSSELGGVLCFEMEAAGLMNSFPCLVIRGICDYADSHKNKTWQPYAAATAAACAKEILSVIPAAEVASTGYSQQYSSGDLDTSSATSYNKHYYVPYNLSGIFTGRGDVLKKLRDGCLPPKPHGRLAQQKRFVLYGLGGSGKTQTCIKFAQDYRQSFWGIFWIDATSHATAQQGFLEIARLCGVEEDAKVVKRWLSNIQEHWLLIIDNADDPSLDVSAFFPTGNRGSIVVTTRNPDCKIHSTVGSYEFGEMDLEDAVTLFLRAAEVEITSAKTIQKEATDVATTLGCLALAIVQAGAYVRKRFCTVSEYCGIYSRHRERLLTYQSVQAGSDYRFIVYTTWEVSVEAIKRLSGKTSDNAIELIRIFCFLHYDGITEEIFERAWRNSRDEGYLSENIAGLFYIDTKEPLAEWDSFVIRDAAGLLASFSLIKIDATGRRMSMHPLVHVWARDRLLEDLQEQYWATASYTLAAAISQTSPTSDYEFQRTSVAHIDSCINLCPDGSFISRYSDYDRIEMAARFALVFAENGRSQSAAELFQKVLEARQRMLGEEHPDTLSAMYSLAIRYNNLERTQEAVELFEKVLEIRQRTLGDEDPETLSTIQCLANSYGDLGRLQEAVELSEKVLEASRRTLGDEHVDTLSAMSNTANCYSELGRVQEAAELCEKALVVKQRTLGDKHPHTLREIYNLAISYSDLGRGQDAVELFEKVLEASQRTLGGEHPETLRAINGLAYSYSDLGRRQEAEELRKKVLEASQRTLGDEHPETLRAINDLARSYSDLGRGQEAVELRKTVLEASQRTLGDEHPHTLSAMYSLATGYSDLGRRQEALELKEKVLEIRQRTLGDEHPHTLSAIQSVADSYRDLGRLQEAVELSEKVLEVRQRTLGDEHRDTLWAIQGVADCYKELGRWQEAVELLENVLKVRQRTLGDEHHYTLSAMYSLAISYSNLGHSQEAVELFEKVLEIRQRTLGDEHLDTLSTIQCLANSYGNLGRLQEAVELSEKVLEASQRTLGDEHPHTLSSMSNTANCYSDLGRIQEAAELCEKALVVKRRTLGDEHPHTLREMYNLAISYNDLKRKQEAVEMFEKVLEASQRTLGDEHPETLRAMNGLAYSYWEQGRRQEAAELNKKVLEVTQRTGTPLG